MRVSSSATMDNPSHPQHDIASVSRYSADGPENEPCSPASMPSTCAAGFRLLLSDPTIRNPGHPPIAGVSDRCCTGPSAGGIQRIFDDPSLTILAIEPPSNPHRLVPYGSARPPAAHRP